MEAQRNSTSFVNLNPHYRGRVRTGCLTCRSKKVRCDEQRPTCKRCIRLKRECVYQTKTKVKDVQHTDGTLVDHKRSHSIPSDMKTAQSQLEQLSPVSPFSSCESNITLPSIDEMTQSRAEPVADFTALSLMTSQDIYLCTTIDWLAANEGLQAVSFSHFLNEVDLPLLTPFDPWNWTHMKAYAVNLASQHKSMAAAISAVQLLWKAQAHSLPTTNAISRYQVAKDLLEADMREDENEFSTILLTAFLLSLFSIVLIDETACIFAQAEGHFVQKLELWSQSGLRTPIVSRIAAWLTILHAAARRGGNQGIMSPRVNDLLSGQYGEHFSLSALASDSPATRTHEFLSTVVFEFYHSLQCLSLQVANLSHYHRSRTTPIDQEEVVRLMACLQAELQSLWLMRPAIMRTDPDKMRAQFPISIAELLVNQIAVSMASYHAEHVDIGRSLGDPLSLTSDAEAGLRFIESSIEGYRNAQGRLSPGYLRPLFLYAIEHENSSNVRWAVDRMKDIKDPISRSDFFASYAQVLAEEQRIKKRRVTTRWFCYERYGVRPPFL